MSLLEKASGGASHKGVQHQAKTSLFQRAMAASRTEPPLTAAPSPLLSAETLEELKEKISSIPPFQDSILSAWSILVSRLPFQAISLFLPRGDFLAPAAQLGFPSGTCDCIPLSAAPLPEGNGGLLSDEAKALAAPSLGVRLDMSLRAVSMRSESDLLGLWIIHDESLDSARSEAAKLIALLAETFSAMQPLPLVQPSSDPVRALRETLDKFRHAAAFRFDLGSLYEDREECRGLSQQALISAFAQAAGKILDQIGAVVAFGQASLVCALGSSSPCDPELSLFQFKKTLRKSLPFLSSADFPRGTAIGLDLSAERSSEALSRFLAI